ncbi:hypothetical protein O6H91_Y216700 [Diphasiastrum complanatum]|nr:hypothetical protein O6H91_Y216700 [Diphasiastrum complanatum]
MDKHIQQIKLFLRALFVFTFEGSSGQWASGQWEIGCLNFTWQATPHLERRLQALAPKKAHYFKPHYRSRSRSLLILSISALLFLLHLKRSNLIHRLSVR